MPTKSQVSRLVSLIRVLATLSPLGALTLIPGCRSGVEDRFAEARAALANDRNAEAARIFRDIAASEPAGPYASRAELELARVEYLRLRDVRSAHDRLVHLLEEHRASEVETQARALLARIYARELDDPERALAHYRVLAENEVVRSKQREYLLAIAECYYALDRLPQARASYREAILPPYSPETDAAYLRLARLESRLGDIDSAIRLLAELELRSSDPANRRAARLTELELLIDGGETELARERLEEAKAVFPPAERDTLAAIETKLLASRTGDAMSAGGTLDSLQARIPWGGGRRARSRARAEREQPR